MKDSAFVKKSKEYLSNFVQPCLEKADKVLDKYVTFPLYSFIKESFESVPDYLKQPALTAFNNPFVTGEAGHLAENLSTKRKIGMLALVGLTLGAAGTVYLQQNPTMKKEIISTIDEFKTNLDNEITGFLEPKYKTKYYEKTSNQEPHQEYRHGTFLGGRSYENRLQLANYDKESIDYLIEKIGGEDALNILTRYVSIPVREGVVVKNCDNSITQNTKSSLDLPYIDPDLFNKDFIDNYITEYPGGNDNDNDVTIIGSPETPLFNKVIEKNLDLLKQKAPDMLEFSLEDTRFFILKDNYGHGAAGLNTVDGIIFYPEYWGSGNDINSYNACVPYHEKVHKFINTLEVKYKSNTINLDGKEYHFTCADDEMVANVAHGACIKRLDETHVGTLKEWGERKVSMSKEPNWELYGRILEKVGVDLD